MMKCYSLHTKIKNEMKLKKWNGYQSNAGQGIKGEGSHTIKKKSKRASASRSLQNKGASVSKTRTFYGSTSKLCTPHPAQAAHSAALLLPLLQPRWATPVSSHSGLLLLTSLQTGSTKLSHFHVGALVPCSTICFQHRGHEAAQPKCQLQVLHWHWPLPVPRRLCLGHNTPGCQHNCWMAAFQRKLDMLFQQFSLFTVTVEIW